MSTDISPTELSPATADPNLLRYRRFAPATLVAGPLILAVAELIHPRVGGYTSVDVARALPGHTGPWKIWAALLILGAAVAVPGLLRLFRVVTSRGVVMTTVGVVLAVGSAIGAAGFAVASSQLAGLVGNGPLDPAVATAISQTEDDLSSVVSIILFLFGSALGWPLLLAGAARAGLARHWQWMAAVVASVAMFVGSGTFPWAEPIGLVVIAVAVAPTAIRLTHISSQRTELPARTDEAGSQR